MFKMKWKERSAYPDQDHTENKTSNGIHHSFFERFCFGIEHPKAGDHEEEKRNSKQYIQWRISVFRLAFVQTGHFSQNCWQFFFGIFHFARFAVVFPLFKDQEIAFLFFYLKIFNF